MEVVDMTSCARQQALEPLQVLAFISLEPQLKKIDIDETFFKSPSVEAVLALAPGKEARMLKEINIASRLSLYRKEKYNLPKAENILQAMECLQSNSLNSWIHGCSRNNSANIKNVEVTRNAPKETFGLGQETDLLLLRREHRYFEKRLSCLECKHNPRGVVSLPCGHVSLCRSCAEGNVICVVCGKQVLAEANVYLT